MAIPSVRKSAIGWAIGLGVWLFTGTLWAETEAQPANADMLPQVLVVAPDPTTESARSLVNLLNENFPLHATLKGHADYRSFIDAWVYDGFVYLGENYYAPPSSGFLSDMSQTEKPLLWINYHAWAFSPKMWDKTGLTVHDQHDVAFNTLNFQGLAPLQGGDTTIATAVPPAQVLYWNFNADLTASIPGAITSGNLTYVAYMPIFDPAHSSIPALRAAVNSAMSQLPESRRPPLDAKARLATAKADAFRSGIHLPYVVSFDDEDTIPYESDDFHRRLLDIKKSGAEWVTLGWTFFQDGVSGSKPEADDTGTAKLAALRNIVEDAHALGLFVRLSVIVNLDEATRKPHEWRGFIRPKNPEEWWGRYRKIVLNAARFAQGTGIESLVIGAELNRMQDDEAHWRQLARDVQTVVGYRGLIGYQVNFDAFDNMTWADALDFLSVAAYWPLAQTRDPSLESLSAAWAKVGTTLSAWLQSHPGVKLEFGEIGYTSQPYSAVFPYSWKPNRARNLSLSEQLNAYLALEDFLQSRTDIVGVSVFASTRYDRTPGDIGYSPFGKPAEEVVIRLMDIRQ